MEETGRKRPFKRIADHIKDMSLPAKKHTGTIWIQLQNPIHENTNPISWGNSNCSWVGQGDKTKMIILPKLMYLLSAISNYQRISLQS